MRCVVAVRAEPDPLVLLARFGELNPIRRPYFGQSVHRPARGKTLTRDKTRTRQKGKENQNERLTRGVKTSASFWTSRPPGWWINWMSGTKEKYRPNDTL